MSVPEDYAVIILVDDEDITAYVPYESMDFEDNLLDVSSFRFTIENPPFVPTVGMAVSIFRANYDNVPAIFDGVIVEAPAYKRNNGIILDYNIEAHDEKVFLQKSIVEYNEFSGIDTDILADLLTATYPDLTTKFDFATDAESFVPSLNFATNDDSLLDALKSFRDATNGNLSFERDPISYRITFDSGDIIDPAPASIPYYQAGAVTSPAPTFSAVDTGGNPNNCYKWQGNGALTAVTEYLAFTMVFRTAPAVVKFVSISFDLWFDFNGQDCAVTIHGDTLTFSAATYEGQWITINFATLSPSSFPVSDQSTQIRISPATNMPAAAWEVRLDNIKVRLTNPGKKKLKYKPTPDAADFDLDIQNSAEYAYDLKFSEGGIDNYNSVTVIGGNETYSVEQIYGQSGTERYLDLPSPIKSLLVYRNTGNDVTPVWTLQTQGEFGVDLLTSEGGSKDVLYNTKNHFLIFNTALPDLNNAVKVTGTIEKPIRVRIENVPTGQNTLATTLYNDKITTEAEATVYGQAELKRRAAKKKLKFTTYNPGLFVGRDMTVIDSSRSLNETLTIQKINTTWLGSSGHAKFDIECSNDEPTNAGALLADVDKRSRKKAAGVAITTVAYEALLDSDNTTLLDSDNSVMYGSAS